MEYTKGKWTQFKDMSGLKEFPEGHIQIVGNNQRDNIAIIPKRWNNHKTNAQLISAAPRMANLLERLINDGWNAGISEEAKEILNTI